MNAKVGGITPFSQASFTRPNDTTAYASGDNMATTTTAASVVPLKFLAGGAKNGSGLILGGRMAKSQANITNAAFRLRLFSREPFAAGSYPADNAAIVATFAALQWQIGFIDFTTWNAESAAAWANATPNTRNAMAYNLGGPMRSNADMQFPGPTGPIFESQVIYGLLEARAAYTPSAGSEQFTINLDIQADS